MRVLSETRMIARSPTSPQSGAAVCALFNPALEMLARVLRAGRDLERDSRDPSSRSFGVTAWYNLRRVLPSPSWAPKLLVSAASPAVISWLLQTYSSLMISSGYPPSEIPPGMINVDARSVHNHQNLYVAPDTGVPGRILEAEADRRHDAVMMRQEEQSAAVLRETES